jgi:hypothetical protein
VEWQINNSELGRDDRMKRFEGLHDLFRKCCQEDDLRIR